MVWKTLKMIDLVRRSTLTWNMLLVACFLLMVVPIASAYNPVGCFYRKDSRPACPCKNSANALNRRLIGGTDAAVGQFPYAVVLAVESTRSNVHPYISAGTLITDKHVLTATHPLLSDPVRHIKIKISEHDSQDGEDGPIFSVSSIVTYPGYNETAEQMYSLDIAIIQLDRPVKWGSDVQAVWLPSPHLNLEAGTIVTVFSWDFFKLDDSGFPSAFQTLQLPIADCKEREKLNENTSFPILEYMVCAGGVKGQGICREDSGGGLVVRLNNKDVLYGITLYAYNCGAEDEYGLFTRVTGFLKWIYENTRSAGCKPCIDV